MKGNQLWLGWYSQEEYRLLFYYPVVVTIAYFFFKMLLISVHSSTFIQFQLSLSNIWIITVSLTVSSFIPFNCQISFLKDTIILPCSRKNLLSDASEINSDSFGWHIRFSITWYTSTFISHIQEQLWTTTFLLSPWFTSFILYSQGHTYFYKHRLWSYLFLFSSKYHF